MEKKAELTPVSWDEANVGVVSKALKREVKSGSWIAIEYHGKKIPRIVKLVKGQTGWPDNLIFLNGDDVSSLGLPDDVNEASPTDLKGYKVNVLKLRFPRDMNLYLVVVTFALAVVTAGLSYYGLVVNIAQSVDTQMRALYAVGQLVTAVLTAGVGAVAVYSKKQ